MSGDESDTPVIVGEERNVFYVDEGSDNNDDLIVGEVEPPLPVLITDDNDDEDSDGISVSVGGGSEIDISQDAISPYQNDSESIRSSQQEASQLLNAPGTSQDSNLVSDANCKDGPPTKRRKISSPKTKTDSEPGEFIPHTQDSDDDGTNCPICFDSWSNTGEHRLVSLKCGHLFGKSCIITWLNGKNNKKCPNCNKKATKKDVRPIYAKKLLMADTSERDQALEDLVKERDARMKAELEAAKSRLMVQRMIEENERMMRQINSMNSAGVVSQMTKTLPVANPETLASLPSTSQSETKHGHYALHKTIKIADVNVCRVLDYNPLLMTLAVSQKSPTERFFPGYGVKKISTVDFKTSRFIHLQHSREIRDICFNPHQANDLLLSCSLDRRLKITSLSTDAIVQTYSTTAPLWSCCWHADNQNLFFAGQVNGIVNMFDMRNTATHVEELNRTANKMPVASLSYVPKKENSVGGLLVSQFTASSLFEPTAGDGGSFKQHMLPFEGKLTHSSASPATSHVLGSFGPRPQNSHVMHVVYKIKNTPGQTLQCEEMIRIMGNKLQTRLARSRLVPHPSGDDSALVVAGDEASKSLYIWDLKSGLRRQGINCQEPVIDVCPVVVNNSHYLAALTDKTVRILKWNS